ncbi:MAG: hypothetical protein QNJ30_27705 [Kiloniellales bacterium]|nr:hypothetical protein [Kiloniellales bacterium]
MTRFRNPLRRRLPALAIVLSLACGAEALAQQPLIIQEGEDDYRWHCVACHGHDGRGRGPMAEVLAIPPSDLTGIARRSGGDFPFWQVYDTISGVRSLTAHQSFQMPGYWERFRGDEAKPGFLPAHVRIVLLTHYLESIQEE